MGSGSCWFVIRIDNDIWDIEVIASGKWRAWRPKLVSGEEYTLLSAWKSAPEEPQYPSNARGWDGRDFWNMYSSCYSFMTGN
jgi:hypothetical protein